MKTFAYSMQGENAWDWYCNFKPKEIKSFPHLIKSFKGIGSMVMKKLKMLVSFLIYKIK
jgi:hypothetical protein